MEAKEEDQRLNYNEHVLAGILSYPLAVLVISLLGTYVDISIKTSFMATSLGYGFYVLGSDLPDLDHPNALIHRIAKPLVSVAVGISAFRNVFPYASQTSYEWMNLSLAWGVATLIAFASWHIFTKAMPKHRGIVHSVAFAAFYALLAFSVVRYGFDLRFGEAVFVGLASFLGYDLHLILDKNMKLI